MHHNHQLPLLQVRYSSAALFNAFASNPLVPPPAHKTKTLVCSLIEFDDSLADTSSSEGAGSVVVASFAPAVAKIASAFSYQSLLILFF